MSCFNLVFVLFLFYFILFCWTYFSLSSFFKAQSKPILSPNFSPNFSSFLAILQAIITQFTTKQAQSRPLALHRVLEATSTLLACPLDRSFHHFSSITLQVPKNTQDPCGNPFNLQCASAIFTPLAPTAFHHLMHMSCTLQGEVIAGL